jgi:triacylglycerol lipase
MGRGVSSAYSAIDPDVRRHIGQLPLMGLTLLSPRRSNVQPIAGDGRRPVVFVHGLVGHPGNFLPMRKFLALKGYKQTYAIALESVSTMSASADQLSFFIEEIIRVNGLGPGATVDCVAHSMGGLVARLALEDSATRARISTLITLGTPHLGTYAARFGATQNVLDLRPGSPVMTRLRAQLPWQGPPNQPRLVALWSPADVLLLPAEAACAPGADAVEMPGFTHYSYLLSPTAWSRVHTVLEIERERRALSAETGTAG